MTTYVSPSLVAAVRKARKEQGRDCNCGGCEYCDVCKAILALGQSIMEQEDWYAVCGHCLTTEHTTAEHQHAAELGTWIVAVQRCKFVIPTCKKLPPF